MKFALPLLALALLSACVSDKQLADFAESRRAFVCSHRQAVTIAANLAIENAPAIKDANLRAAAVAVAQSDLAIVAACDLI